MARPKKRFACGGVAANIWENKQTAEEGTFTVESVTFSRRYKNSSDNWVSTSSFRKNDLPKLEVVCRKAYEFLNEKQAQTESSDESD